MNHKAYDLKKRRLESSGKVIYPAIDLPWDDVTMEGLRVGF